MYIAIKVAMGSKKIVTNFRKVLGLAQKLLVILNEVDENATKKMGQ